MKTELEMTMPKLFFCWEKSATGRWSPVCYHNAEPKLEKLSTGDAPSRSVVRLVSGAYLDDDGNPRFSLLIKAFPAPVEVA